MIGKDEKLWNEVKAFPIFLKVYCAVVLGFVTLINEIIKIFMVYFVGVPLAIIGLILYFFIVKPLKWVISLFIKIERIDIYE